MPPAIDLNCDMGESFGLYSIGADAAIAPFITSANLGCGFHGGDPRVMRESIELCKTHNVAIGAHPGLPDLAGFGRRRMAVSPNEVRDMVTYQIGALAAFAHAAGVKLQHVKPHGALYMMALEDDAISDAICEAVARFDPGLMLFTTAGLATERAAKKRGLRVVREFFADRPLSPNGWVMFGSKLTDIVAPGSPGTPEPPITAGLASRATRVAVAGKTTLTDGSEIRMKVDTICVHSDTPNSPAIMQAVLQALVVAGVEVRKPA
ncbi:MAG: 5-oxoprolinase subunit PxpA [Planctomycetota bacterium]|nr:5-oxoprolinase subunit PxpA [Planctomycetota bacterium]